MSCAITWTTRTPSPFDRPLTESQQRELKHGYYAAVSFIDARSAACWMNSIASVLPKNTIVVLWGDHGWKLGEHDGWCKQTNYEIDTRVPLMIRAPGTKANGQSIAAHWSSSSTSIRHSATWPGADPESLEGTA